MNTTTEPQTSKIIRNILLICGIVSSLLFIFTDIFAVLMWEAYSYSSQTVSELIAFSTPTRHIPALNLTGPC
ncbi:MAG: hypothetical protein WC833_03840 [Bacteroidales bacterium]|jgi:hypothetical protein